MYKYKCKWCNYMNCSNNREDFFTCEACGRETSYGWNKGQKKFIITESTKGWLNADAMYDKKGDIKPDSELYEYYNDKPDDSEDLSDEDLETYFGWD